MRRDVLVPALLLLAAAALGHTAQLTREMWTGTEPFRVLVGHEMARSGDWLVPRLGGEVVLTKPPFQYWVLATVDWLVGGMERFWARLPSVVSLWLAACVAWTSVRRVVGERAGRVAGIGTILAPNLVWHGGYAEIDPLFAGLAAISMLWLAEAIATAPRGEPARGRLMAAGLVGALAMLTKGPPFAMFLIGAAVVWWKHARFAGWAWFLLPLLLPTITYYLLLTYASSVTPEQFAAVAAAESVGRVAAFGWDSLVHMPLHPLNGWAVALPFAFWLWPALRRGPDPDQPDQVFARTLAWSYVAAVLVLLVFPRRPTRYLLPGTPLVAAAAAPWIALWLADRRPGPTWARVAVRAFGAAAAVGLAVAPWLPHPLPGRTWFAFAAIATAGLLVRGRPALFGFALLLPVLLTYTALRDRQQFYRHGVRGEEHLAAVMRDELAERGVDTFEFWGNPGEGFALHVDPRARWRDRGDRSTAARWVVTRVYDGAALTTPEGTWTPRLRLRGKRQTWVLLERD